MKSIFIAVLTVLGGILTGCTTTSHFAKSDSCVEHVKFIASLPRHNVDDQPINLRLRIENDRSDEIAMEWWDRATSITIENARNGAVPRTVFGTGRFISPESRTTALLQASVPQPHGYLRPHHSDETTVDLNQYFQLKPGAYFLSASAYVWAGRNHGQVLKLQTERIPFTIGNGAQTDEVLTKQIAAVLKEYQTIKPGMTRADLSSAFTTEGGLSFPNHRTYVYRGCPYIKIDIDFTPANPSQNSERPTDVIAKLSKPYLDWSISD